MSIPHIHGVTSPGPSDTMLAAWSRPGGEFPDELWPSDVLGEFRRRPTEWVTVCQHIDTDGASDGRSTVLVANDDREAALADVTWIGRGLGSCYGGDDQAFESGLHDPGWHEPPTDFLAQVTRPYGAQTPVIDVTPSFLWFWDAYPVTDGWDYLDNAGDAHPLIRTTVGNDSWTVRMRAMELRKFLHASKRTALVQVDIKRFQAADEFERIDDEIRLDWSSMDFHAIWDSGFGLRPFSRTLGRYFVESADGPRRPRPEDWRPPHGYPDFIYGVDDDGRPLRYSADPDALGTYFDRGESASRLHYLTTVCFRPEVLERYLAEPMKYRVTSTRLECLGLWGVSIGRTSTGLVEVYLGDVGRDIPHQHWPHWLQYNVPPEGSVDEGRFRRDILNQPASSPNAMDRLRAARESANEASTTALGDYLWRDPGGLLARQFDSLQGPTRDDPSRLHEPLMVLAKVFVDSLNMKLLRSTVRSAEPDAKSLTLLGALMSQLGSAADRVEVLRRLQTFRSRGGPAHRTSDSDATRAAKDLGIDGLSASASFELVVAELTEAVEHVAQVLSD